VTRAQGSGHAKAARRSRGCAEAVSGPRRGGAAPGPGAVPGEHRAGGPRPRQHAGGGGPVGGQPPHGQGATPPGTATRRGCA
jgi:hypothetical protein